MSKGQILAEYESKVISAREKCYMFPTASNNLAFKMAKRNYYNMKKSLFGKESK